jgi:outer membrane protein assembly factor BamB
MRNGFHDDGPADRYSHPVACLKSLKKHRKKSSMFNNKQRVFNPACRKEAFMFLNHRLTAPVVDGRRSGGGPARPLAVIAVIVGCLLAAAGCDSAAGMATVSDRDLERGTVVFASSRALVTFCAGDVAVRSGSSRSPVAVGMFLSAGQTLSVGASSSCELQIGDKAVVAAGERTELVIEDLLVKAGGTRAGLRLVEGSLASKVTKLTGSESFRVRTASAVCGVRGTEFGVAVSGGGPAVVSVRQGAVYVLPARAEVRETAEPDALARTVQETLEADAPRVTAGQEMSLTADAVAAMEQALADVIPGLEGMGAREKLNAEAADALRVGIDAAARVLKEKAPTPRAISGEHEAELRKLDGAVFLPAVLNSADREPEAGRAAPALVKFEFIPTPADALVTLDGRTAGRGRFQGIFAVGTKHSLAVSREGYADEVVPLEVTTNGEKTIRIELKKRSEDTEADQKTKEPPLAGTFQISGAAFIGDLASAGDRIFAADKSGKLFALNDAGVILWKIATKNRPNNNSSPILINGRVYFSGLRELVIVDAAAGTHLARLPLEGAANHMFGRHVIAAGERGVLPADRSLRFFNLATGATVRIVALPADSRMTPTLFRGKLYLIDTRGRLQVIDPQTGAIDPVPLETNAAEPVAIGIAVAGNLGYVAGRKNRLVCIDLASRKLLWETGLTAPDFAHQDLTADDRGVYVYAGKKLYGFSPQGVALFTPIDGVSAPPLLADGRLYVGTTAGQFRIIDPGDGSVRASLELHKTVSARPVAVSGMIAVGTVTGEIVLIRPESM